MFAAGMTKRWLRVLACLGLLGFPVAACKVYEPDLIQPMTSGHGGQDGGGVAGQAGDSMPDTCVPSAETCNNIDDDCNGIVDDEQPATADCSARYHASVPCNRDGLCLFIPSRTKCDSGWYHCDGLPETGCETTIPCCMDCDAGSDDGGSDDSGT
jgi:hypothetical protein